MNKVCPEPCLLYDNKKKIETSAWITLLFVGIAIILYNPWFQRLISPHLWAWFLHFIIACIAFFMLLQYVVMPTIKPTNSCCCPSHDTTTG